MEKKKLPDSWYYCLLGAAAGFLNGLFGAGGGMAVVPLLEMRGLESKKAHATSIAIILPLSLFSALIYLWGVTPQWGTALACLPLGAAGAVAGAKFLKNISGKALRRVFAVVMLISAIRLWVR